MDWSRADLSLQRLAVFVAVVERNGYTAAAEHLDMAQPSVSYHVKSLERALGAKLLVYRNRSVHLTPEGEEAFRSARVMLNEGHALHEMMEAMTTGRSGRLGFGASIAFEHRFFVDGVVTPFAAANPDIAITLRFGHSIDLVEAVGDRSLDAAYVNDWQIPPGLTFQHLHTSDVVFLASADHHLSQLDTVTPEQINEAGLIVAPIERGEVIGYTEMLRSAGIVSPNVVIEIDGVQARKLAAESGLGVFATFVPAYAGLRAMDPLRVLSVQGPRNTINFGLVTRSGYPWSGPMTKLADWLHQATAAV